MRLIGISGKRASGKSLLATILKDKYGYTIFPLAEYLKDMCNLYFELEDEQLNGSKKEERDPRYYLTPREIMIRTGNFFRSVDPMFWIKAVWEGIENDLLAENKSDKFVIPDVRFQNEANFIRSKGGLIVRLERETGLVPLNDPSETELDNYEWFDIIQPAEVNKVPEDLEAVAKLLDHVLKGGTNVNTEV